MKTKLAAVLLLVVSGALYAQKALIAYTTLDEKLAMELFDRFEQETGISVNFERLPGGEALRRIEAEIINPRASIWVGGVGIDHITAKDKNLSVPYISRYAGNTRPGFKDTDGYWIGLYVAPLVFATNADYAKVRGLTAPKSWASLIGREYEKNVRMANPNTSGTAYNTITTILALNNMNEDAAFDYLKRLDLSIDKYEKEGPGPAAAVAAAEVPVAIGYAHDFVRLKSQGYKLEITSPSEGTGYELASMSLLRGGKQMEEARRLYDWMLSSKNAQRIFNRYFLDPVAKGAERNAMALSLDEIKTINQDMAWDGDPVNKARLVDRWNREIGGRR